MVRGSGLLEVVLTYVGFGEAVVNLRETWKTSYAKIIALLSGVEGREREVGWRGWMKGTGGHFVGRLTSLISRWRINSRNPPPTVSSFPTDRWLGSSV
jgi:hypothetical protein